MGYNMQIKVNFLCKDSILAAPVVLDVALLMDLAKRHGMRGTQEWLSFFFKSPMVVQGEAVNDLFAQQAMLMQQLNTWARQARRDVRSIAA
jgi:myo-inositol-1-phosphate synthase